MKCYIVAQNGCSYASPTSDAQDSSENSPTPSSALYPNTTMRYTPKPTDVVYGLLFILVVLFLLYIGYYAARPRRVVHKEQAWANENGKKNIDDVEEKEEEIVSTPQTQTPHTPEPEITSVKGGSAPLKGDEVDTVRLIPPLILLIFLDSVCFASECLFCSRGYNTQYNTYSFIILGS